MNRLTVFFTCLLVSPTLFAADRDVRGEAVRILSDKCFACHGPDENTREADLRLDTFEGATRDLGDYVAIKPGDPTASELINRIQSTDPDLRMPPPDSKSTLSKQEIEILTTWVRQGAEYQPHWAFRPLIAPLPPKVDTDWPNTPIDTFIYRSLTAQQLSPSREAPRATLIRRVHLDLLGLPPTPEDVASFVNDESPHAFERMVDRVLASPHYGERWGRHWLDQARYADTHGYTIDSERTMWPFRDWVIRAINADMPFDQFTVEQLAGDLLPQATQSQLIATGFHRNTLVNQEGGSDREQFRNEAVVDRVNTTGAVWLGLTVGCAQCHHHKFDPISQKDYYQLFAFFNSGQDANGVAPTLRVVSDNDRLRLDSLDAAVADAKQRLAEYDQAKNDQRSEDQKDDGKPVEWTILNIGDAQSKAGAKFEQLEDQSWVVSGENGESETYTLKVDRLPKRVTGVRLETLTHPSLPKGGPGRASNGNFVLNDIQLRIDDQRAEWLHASADHSQKDYDVSKAIDGDLKTGWAINVSKGRMNVNRTAKFVADELLNPSGEGGTITLRFGDTPAQYNIGRFRVAVTSAPLAKLDLPDPQRKKLEQVVAKAQAERDKFAKGFPSTMIMRELDKPRESHIHIRGDFLRKGDPVTPNVPASLPQMQRASDSMPNRLDLARWLVDEQNPLTARVKVNRVWGRLFGVGLVETENDFGLQSTPPTHPELLDWLAAEFVRGGWSVKRLHRMIVCSSVYRQSSNFRADIADKDPLNKLLGRQNRVRVEGEIVRDISLVASGLFSSRIGGPSVRPPQPDGVYAFTQRNAAWPVSKGADRYRRGMYTFFMRSAPYPMLTTFDSPKFNTTCTRRVRSNTPLQSLTMANDETMLDAARALGRRLAAHTGSDAERLDAACRICYSRPITKQELKVFERYLASQRQEFKDDPDSAKQLLSAEIGDDQSANLAAWTMVARVFINLDEFIVRE